jgi:hypothetical protein
VLTPSTITMAGPPVDQGARRARRRLVARLPLRRRRCRRQVTAAFPVQATSELS